MIKLALKVKFYSLFRINLKSSGTEYELDNEITIAELIEKLDQEYDGYFTQKLLEEDRSISAGAIILVNGHNVLHLDQLETKISNQDIVTLFPPSAGG
ncbi:MAG: molybdopterin synthase sulfur carrier subunit [Halanaerobium sp. 4-GBenrich]|uniref:MoaD family protein n=1 Tax=Halanaerobium congolense TaxID=54121 RepID=UPI0007965AD6|nr:MoaD family protein [Halanaerobium congolense]KXS47462.1 MAG: molybdopterin synthase sulfur carrier subunit [Halanaerobium sp. T82-1]ODS50330.1 MAG: molybdopterin synthase sulfur carrier subunit [Halanaerobium sp. 4-GBenrich]